MYVARNPVYSPHTAGMVPTRLSGRWVATTSPRNASSRSVAAVHPGGDRFLADLEEQFTALNQAAEAE